MEDKIIDLINISKSFGEAKILDNLNLYVRRNEFVTLLGPSGCGKTTTLRIIAGFETADSGSIMFDNVNIANTPPHKRKLNTVFQKYALFPNMTVEQNIGFGLTIKKIDKKLIKEEVNKMLKLVNLVGYNDRRITELSGGQQQRIAIARALINKPEVLLLDEPLGALDLKLRKEMQIELKNMQKTLGITFIYVTHDQEEALTMSDTIVVMNNGIIQQIGTAEDIYNEPKNAFVADFIGESNIIDGYMDKDYSVTFAGHTFECVDPMFIGHNDIEVVVRPEDIVLINNKDQGHLNGVVTNAIFKGVHYEMTVEVNHNGTTIPFLVHSISLSQVDTEVSLCIDPVSIHIMKKLNQSNTSNKVEMVTE